MTDSPISRRAAFELGLEVSDVRPALPGYRYRAEFQGIVENEICPVYLGRFTGRPAPDPIEVLSSLLANFRDFPRVGEELRRDHLTLNGPLVADPFDIGNGFEEPT